MVVLTVSEGKLKGGEAISENGVKYYEFLSVPYAKPPVGELRFKNPQSPEPWENERDATVSDTTNMSCQINLRNGQVIGSEDCLYLNVYTPRLPSPDSPPLPVMVFIHGGGFIYGSGIMKQELGPDFIIENEVVLVTINYRLGVLGFLNLDIPEASGNMGLKDQVKALEWVQKNIHNFNGDKNNVTLIGISAGSASVEYLLLSPLAKGLFHKAIQLSGSTLNDWAINCQHKELSTKLVETLGYEGSLDDKYAIYELIQNVPTDQLMSTAFQVTEKSTSKTIFFRFAPTVEKDFGNAFLTERPYKLLKEGNFTKVPVIKGFCEREGLLMNMMKPSAVKELISYKKFVDYWSYLFDAEDKDKFNNEFSKLYLEKVKEGDEEDGFAIEYFGDFLFTTGILIALQKMVNNGVPAYAYKFSYDGKINGSKLIFGLKKKGAAHTDDLTYIFNHHNIKNFQPGENDILMRSRITKMWTNFAKTGNPNSSEIPIEWPKFTEESKEYLNIDKEFQILSKYQPDKLALFAEIYDKYEK